MEDFIRKFSTVPVTFINDFFNISKEEYDDYKFNINFDLVVKWLRVQKNHLKRTLTNLIKNAQAFFIKFAILTMSCIHDNVKFDKF